MLDFMQSFDAGNKLNATKIEGARIASGGSPVTSFQHIARDASSKGYGKLRSITIRLCVTNCTGELYFTDLMLQAGSVATGWVGHVCEIQWTLVG